MKIGIVAFSDYQTYPLGGGLSFLREFIRAAGELPDIDLSLVGWCVAKEDAATRQIVQIGRRDFPFVAVGSGVPSKLIPDRAAFYSDTRSWHTSLSAIGQIDVFYCHSPESVLGVVRGGTRSPIALHLHGASDAVGRSRFRLGRTRIVKWLYRSLALRPALSRADAVLATVSREEHRALLSSGEVRAGVPCVRIPAMVNERFAQPVSRLESNVLRLVCVGRLEAIKGIELPIGTVAELLKRGVEARLEILGDGSERPRLERLVSDLGLSDRVTFMGTRDSEDVARIVGNADVFVSGSRQEGFSLALIEALAVGTPAVVTNVGSATEVVLPDTTGALIEGRDAASFADAIIRVVSGGSRIREACRRVAQDYSSGKVSNQILDVLKGIARRPADASSPPPDPVATVAEGVS